jgi:predicted ATPase
VWFVSLASLVDATLTIPTIGRGLGLRETGSDTWEHTVTRHLERRQLLLVIDNIEQLLPDAATAVAQLLVAAAHLRLVVTSREPLKIAFEHRFPVDPFGHGDAVTLFTERARAAIPAFELTDENRASVEAICERVDRLPLAIELAASWIKSLPPAQLLTRLQQRLPLLTGGTRDAPERQRTLRSAIAWSHGLLASDEQQAFAGLSVFAGGCTLDAAEAVCDTHLPSLAALIDKSLVRLEAAASVEPRYVMLETIREFAAERLSESSDAGPVARQHCAYYLALSERAEPELKSSKQRMWLDQLEMEHDNLRAALRWALVHEASEDALRLAAALWTFWYMHGHMTEGRRWLSTTLKGGAAVPSPARAKALVGLGCLVGEQGEVDAALRLMEDSLSCAREVHSATDIAIAAALLCAFLPDHDIDRAEALGEEAAELSRQTGDRYTLAVALNNLGETARIRGDDLRAVQLYEEGCVIRRELGDTSRLALSLSNLGEMALIRGDRDRARSMLSEALDIARTIGDKRHVTFALGDLGYVALSEGNLDEAERLLQESLRLVREIRTRQFAHVCFYGLAAVAAARGQPERAACLAASAERDKALVGTAPSVVDAHIHDRLLVEARRTSDVESWKAAWEKGSFFTLDETIDYALTVMERR